MSKAFECAMRLLVRREHGAVELRKKLSNKGYSQGDIEDALGKCQELDLQSDARFVEIMCRTRIRQGNGPIKIRQELQGLQVDRVLIDKVLQLEKDNWLSYAIEVWKKKYKVEVDVLSYASLQKQKQFLLYRGFSMDTISLMFGKKCVLKHI